MKRAIIILGIAAVASVASAQNRNAFKPMDSILGVTVTTAQTAQGTYYTVSLANNATVIRDGKSHDLKVIEGFWLLADQGDIGAVQSAMARWDARSNNSGGTSAYGFQTQKKYGIERGESQTFTFKTIANPGAIDHFGYKVYASGVPAHIYEAKPVPEPASLAALGLGIAAIIRRKRKAS
jgi:hypothetical protein